MTQQLMFETAEASCLPVYPATPYERIRYWVQEREGMRQKKAAGQPRPWTTDLIISQYRWCNVRRKDDRVSRWILRHIIDPYREHPHLWLMLAIARWVNWPPTLQELMDRHLWPVEQPDWIGMAAAVDARRQRREKAWTGAYMIHAENDSTAPYYKTTKGQEVFRGYFGEGVWPQRAAIQAALRTCRQQDVHRVLVALHGWDSFMAGQVVADYTWTPLLDKATDLYTWAALGPGSEKGLNRLHGRSVDKTLHQSQGVTEFVALRERLIADLPWTETLTLMDTQNIACEGDKFLRVLNGEGRPRSLYRPETAYEV